MANKNHSLDKQITNAAQREFLENGYDKASLRKIAAEAGVTIGAIYTRYKTKDLLFCALVQPLVERITGAFSSIKSAYDSSAGCSPAQLAKAMQMESEAILHLLFDDYPLAVLLLCRSTGSSLEHFFDGIVSRKVEETILFFQNAKIPHPPAGVLRLMTTAQFHMYFQIVNEGYSLEDAKAMMHEAIVYHTGGWLALLKQYSERNEEVSL